MTQNSLDTAVGKKQATAGALPCKAFTITQPVFSSDKPAMKTTFPLLETSQQTNITTRSHRHTGTRSHNHTDIGHAATQPHRHTVTRSHGHTSAASNIHSATQSKVQQTNRPTHVHKHTEKSNTSTELQSPPVTHGQRAR